MRRTTSSLAVVAMLLALSAAVRAGEPVEKFLHALRAKGYHDLAVEYLKRVVNTPHADEDFKRRYPYELGSVLLEAARAASDAAVRDRLAEQGLEQLREFIAANGEHELAAAANMKMGETLLERGRALVARAELSRDKEKLRAQARAMLVEAGQVFEAVEKHRLAGFEQQAPGADRETRNRLGGPILEARLKIADATSEAAKTYEADSSEAQQALKQGIARYKELYDKYHADKFLAAYIARVREAENHLQLGKADDALSRLDDVLALDLRDDALRDLVLTPAYLAALKAWNAKGEHSTALEKAEAYAGNPSPAEARRPDWLEMQYLLAAAYQEHAQTLKPGDAQRLKYEAEARKLAGHVVKFRSEAQNDARLLLGKLGRPADENHGDAKTFAEAVDKATTAIQEYTGAKLAGDTAAEAELSERERLAAQVAAGRDAAFRAARRAVSLADQGSELAKINTARFYLCYLHWEYGQAESAQNKTSSHYFDAAVLGEFLARRFPDHASARQGMAIALASYQRIRQDVAQEAQQVAEKAGKQTDEVRVAVDAAAAAWSDKIAQLAQYAIAKWPDTDEAGSAVAVLASVAVERQDFESALKLVEKLKPDTARRADAELRIGRAIWANYTRMKKVLDAEAKLQAEQASPAENGFGATRAAAQNGDAQQPAAGVDRKTLAGWAKQAQTLLESGLGFAKSSGEIDRGAVLGLWALVQSYVSTSQPDKAIPWLEDETLGLLKLVNDKHEAAEIEGLMFDAYRLALRAYIAVKPQQLDKALATMDALEKITGSDAKGRELLTTVYLAMGRDLQQEIQELVAAGNSSEVATLSAAFEAFLKRLVGRESGNTFNSLFWVADTYAELGSGLAQADKNSAADRARSKEYFQQSADAFEKIRQRAKDDADFMPEKYRPLVETRLAKAYRGAGEHNQALALLVRILKDKPNVLDLQFEAAYTYQEFAGSDPAKRGRFYRYAILGGDKGDYRSIWGWNSLAERIRTQEQRLRSEADDPVKAEQAEQYRQRYHEARYNSVYCTFALAGLATNPSEKERLLKVAKQGIWSVYAIVDSQLGGSEWRTKNGRLLGEVQTALGEPAVGLREFEQRKQQQSQTAAAKM